MRAVAGSGTSDKTMDGEGIKKQVSILNDDLCRIEAYISTFRDIVLIQEVEHVQQKGEEVKLSEIDLIITRSYVKIK